MGDSRKMTGMLKTLGISGEFNKAAKMSDESLDILETAGDPKQAALGLGVSGKGLEWLSTGNWANSWNSFRGRTDGSGTSAETNVAGSGNNCIGNGGYPKGSEIVC